MHTQTATILRRVYQAYSEQHSEVSAVRCGDWRTGQQLECVY